MTEPEIYNKLERGRREDRAVVYSRMDRFIDWLFPHPNAAAEREIMLEIARRIRIKTDILEAKNVDLLKTIAAPVAVRETTIGYWEPSFQYNKLPVRAVVRLYKTNDKRAFVIESVSRTDKGTVIEFDEKDVTRFLKTQETFRLYVLPWTEGPISMETLRRRTSYFRFV